MLTTAKRTRYNYATVDVKPENVTPLYDNLLVRRIYDKPTGSVIDPGMHQTLDGRWLKNSDEGPRKGIVLAVGQGDKRLLGHIKDNWPVYARISMDVCAGDVIIYPRFESSHVKIGEEMLTFVREADVMAIIEDD